MEVVNRNLDDLIPYINNPRTHSDTQISQIAASLIEFGWTNPILTNGNNGIAAGHGRGMAAKKIRDSGAKIPNWEDNNKVPTIDLAHLSKTQIKAYVIADNRLAEKAGWDYNILKVELEELINDDFDLEKLGFEAFDIENILGVEVDDPEKNWDGMPQFENEDQRSFHQVVVHFASLEHIAEFSKLIGQNVTDSTKSIWHPKVEAESFLDKRYVVEDDES